LFSSSLFEPELFGESFGYESPVFRLALIGNASKDLVFLNGWKEYFAGPDFPGGHE